MNRRSFVKTAGAVTTLGTVALSGCSVSTSGPSSGVQVDVTNNIDDQVEVVSTSVETVEEAGETITGPILQLNNLTDEEQFIVLENAFYDGETLVEDAPPATEDVPADSETEIGLNAGIAYASQDELTRIETTINSN